MGKGRLEAFSDGVIAIIITIMVLELKVPHGADWTALRALSPVFLSYVLSFVYVGIYWNNHHHLFQAVHKVNGRILWANLHLLFWLSLTPFVTGWMGENHFAPLPVALYGVNLFMAAISYTILVRALLAHHGPDSTLARAIGKDFKGLLSLALYFVAIPLSFVNPWIGFSFYVLVAVIWFLPDRRIEKQIAEKDQAPGPASPRRSTSLSEGPTRSDPVAMSGPKETEMKKRKLHLHRETLKPLAAPGALFGGRPEPATSPTLCFTCPCPPSIFTDCGF